MHIASLFAREYPSLNKNTHAGNLPDSPANSTTSPSLSPSLLRHAQGAISSSPLVIPAKQTSPTRASKTKSSATDPQSSAEPTEADLPPTIARAIHRIITWRESLFGTLNHFGVKSLLCELVRCASWQKPEKEIFIGNQTLCLRLNISLPTLKRGLKSLVDAGWIEREQMRSSYNKFLGTNTWLTRDAILNLGLHLKPESLFSRGSDVSHTIGYLDIQSSSKRQGGLIDKNTDANTNTAFNNSSTSDSHLIPSDPTNRTLATPASLPESFVSTAVKTPGNIHCSIEPTSEAIDQTPIAPLSITPAEAPTDGHMVALSCTHKNKSLTAITTKIDENSTKEPQELIRCIAPDGKTISLPVIFKSLLAKLAAHHICRLMGDASRAGHRLEDIFIACEQSILKSNRAMPYIRRLIQHKQDWHWVRTERLGYAQQVQADAKLIEQAQHKRSVFQQFLYDHDGRRFANADATRTYSIAGGSCSVSWFESGLMRSAAVLICEKFIAAVSTGKLKNVE